jgi:hypothetical protein
MRAQIGPGHCLIQETVAHLLAPVLAPTVGGGFQLEGTAVLARFEERSDKGTASYPDRDRTRFLQKILRGARRPSASRRTAEVRP